MPSVDVGFRGEEMTVVVDQYDYDPETNGLEVAWHFEDMPPHVFNKLSITDDEEASIVAAISSHMEDRYDDDDGGYDYHNDR